MKTPTPGRILNYVCSEDKCKGEIRPLLVVKCFEETLETIKDDKPVQTVTTYVNGFVFFDGPKELLIGSGGGNGVRYTPKIKLSEDVTEVGTAHWPVILKDK